MHEGRGCSWSGRESGTSWTSSASGIGYDCSLEGSLRDDLLGGIGLDKSGLESLEKEYDMRLRHWQRYSWQRDYASGTSRSG